jgi:hypothetical protein
VYAHPDQLISIVRLQTAEARRAAARHRQASQAHPARPHHAPIGQQPGRDGVAGRRRQAGRVLLALAAVAAAAASVEALASLGAEPAPTELQAAWRAFGLVVFAGLFALVASVPERYPGVLELAIVHKAALTLWAMGSQASDATLVVVADGVLMLALITAYVLLASHRSWRAAHAGRARPTRPSAPRNRTVAGATRVEVSPAEVSPVDVRA